ncbi:basic proline-rich protein-like [Ammospiza nelsoni]|uniref:basic proline-rich protein-like n=1 Tax=Ammospiza nelsoni TaxID=2857394 RepID=UPI002869CF39|nr:basic proline-rich protein-like [Ammospiza nelsoni]
MPGPGHPGGAGRGGRTRGRPRGPGLPGEPRRGHRPAPPTNPAPPPHRRRAPPPTDRRRGPAPGPAASRPRRPALPYLEAAPGSGRVSLRVRGWRAPPGRAAGAGCPRRSEKGGSPRPSSRRGGAGGGGAGAQAGVGGSAGGGGSPERPLAETRARHRLGQWERWPRPPGPPLLAAAPRKGMWRGREGGEEGGERPPKKNVRISSAPRPRPASPTALLAAIPKRRPIAERGRAAVTARSPPTRRIGPARHRRDHAPLSGEPFCGMFTSRPRPAPAAPPAVLPPAPGTGANRFGGESGGGGSAVGPEPGGGAALPFVPDPFTSGMAAPHVGRVGYTCGRGAQGAHTHSLPHTPRTLAHAHTHARTHRGGGGGGPWAVRAAGGGAFSSHSQWRARKGAWPPRQWPPPSLPPPRTHTLSHSPPPPRPSRASRRRDPERARASLPSHPPRFSLRFPPGRPPGPWEAIPVKGGETGKASSPEWRGNSPRGGLAPRCRSSRPHRPRREGGREGGVRDRPLPAAEGGREPGQPVPPRRQPAFPSARTRGGRGG